MQGCCSFESLGKFEPVSDYHGEMQMMQKEKHLDSHFALGRINEFYRNVLVDYFFEELSYDEIAEKKKLKKNW